MLLTRRLERARARPLGFVANEYALAVWGASDMSAMLREKRLDLGALFDDDMLGDDLEAWLAESALMKRTFRACAVISGLIPRRFPGKEKSRRQVLFSTDLVYDVLRQHQADHVLLRAARADAATGLLDLKRLGDLLSRVRGQNRSQGTRPRIAAGGAGDAGNRPRSGLWRSSRRASGGERRRTRARGDRIGTRLRMQQARAEQPIIYREAVIRVAGIDLVADSVGALIWPEERVVVVSDLHLEKGSSFAMRGTLLPPYDTAATLAQLAAVIARYNPRTVISLGDSFHDGEAHERLSDADRASLAAMQTRSRLDLDCRQSRSRSASPRRHGGGADDARLHLLSP